MRPVRGVLLVLAPIEIALVVAVALGAPIPPRIRVAVGVLVVATLAIEVAIWLGRFRSGRRAGASRRASAIGATRDVVGERVWRLIRFEHGLLAGLARWALRREVVPAGARGFSSHRAITPMLTAVCAVSVVELVIVHVLLPWPAAQVSAAVLGVWGLVWALGFRAALITRPHVVTASHLVLRAGVTTEVRIPIADIDAVHVRPRDASNVAAGAVEADPDGGPVTVAFPVASQTTVDIELRRPVTLAGVARGRPVSRIRCHADDPAALAAAASRGSSNRWDDAPA